MTDFELLYLIAFALYISECLCWLPDGAFAFVAPRRRPWRASRRVVFSIPALRLRAFLSYLLPGFGPTAVCVASPPPFGNHSICRCSNDGDLASISYEELGAISRQDCTVRTGYTVLFKAASPVYAEHSVRLLGDLRLIGQEQRAAIIDRELNRILDCNRVRRMLARYNRFGGYLQTHCLLLFLLSFVCLPLLFMTFGLVSVWPVALVGLILAARIIWLFARLFRVLVKEMPHSRLQCIAMMLFMPLALFRAGDSLVRELVADSHLLAVAAAASSQQHAIELAAFELRRLRYPIQQETEGCCSSGQWVRQHWERCVVQFIEREFGSAEQVLRPPERQSVQCRAYCPRCLAQYVVEKTLCADCPGVSLEPFVTD